MFHLGMTLLLSLMAPAILPPGSSSNPLENATALYRLHYDDAAVQELHRIPRQGLDPRFHSSWDHMMGSLLLREGKVGEAIPFLESAQASGGLLQNLSNKELMKAYRENGNPKKAKETWNNCQWSSPQEGLLEKARNADAAGESKNALSLWKSLLKKAKRHTPRWEVRERIALLLEAKGEQKAAKRHWKKLYIQWPRTPQGERSKAHILSNSLDTKEKEARATRLWDVRLYDEAYAAFDALRSSKEHKDWAHLMMGRLLSERKRTEYPKAIEHFQTCAGAKDKEIAGTCLYKSGIAMGKIHEYEEAISTLRTFRKKYPANRNYVEAGYEVGRHMMESGDFLGASTFLEKWVRGEKRLSDKKKYLWFSAWAAYRGKAYKEVIRILKPLRKSGRTLVGDKALYWSAMAYRGLNNEKRAETLFSSCLARFPLSYYSWLATEALNLPETHPRRNISFEDSISADEDPWKELMRAPEKAQVAMKDARTLIHIGAIERAREEWGRLRSRRSFRANLGSSLGLVDDAMNTLLEEHYSVRKKAFSAERKVRRKSPDSQNIHRWRAIFPRAYRSLARVAAHMEGLPEWLLYAHMLQESRYGTQMISGANAFGVLQILPSTARKIAIDIQVPYTERWLFDAGYNIRQAAWYLGALAKRFRGQLPLASASYNGGPLLLSFHMKQYPDLEMPELIEALPTHQSRNYVRKVIEHLHRYLGIYESAERRLKVMRSLFPKSLNRNDGTTPAY